jgi:hypothetical protein
VIIYVPLQVARVFEGEREREREREISINIIRTCMALYITTTLPITSPLVGVPLSYYVLII